MTAFLITRLGQSLIVLFVVSFCIYGLIGLMPGDPIDLMISMDPELRSEDVERLKALAGLDRPLWERYLDWLGAALGGDLGYSRLFNQPVASAISEAFGNTALLLGSSFVLSIALALPIGIGAAMRPRSLGDYLVNLLAFAGISIPPFWLALLLIMLFAVTLGWLPAGGFEDGLAGLKHAVLPIAALTLASIGSHTRYVRAAMIEVMRADFIRTARAKGLPEHRVVLAHGLRNALLPVITIVALDFGFLFSGALITETIFAYPGMGKLIFEAVMGNDFNLALATLLAATAMTLVGNLFADLAYVSLDPRISYQGAES
ncbi:MAG: ABC transporter permease [Magnetovibrionaceae bacterium]